MDVEMIIRVPEETVEYIIELIEDDHRREVVNVDMVVKAVITNWINTSIATDIHGNTFADQIISDLYNGGLIKVLVAQKLVKKLKFTEE